MSINSVRDLISEIRDDNRSGASEITETAARCLVVFAETFKGSTRQDLIRGLSEVGREIVECQPTMAPLYNLVNRALLDADEAKTVEEGRARVRQIVSEFVKSSREGWKRIADHALPLLEKHSTVLTHSYSATLFWTLCTLHDRMKEFSVICTESRPLREGLTLARRLAEKGIRVQLIVDAAAFQLLDRVSLVFVGADAISPLGVTNKIGTCGLAAAAHSWDVPFYVVAGTEKCFPRDLRVDLEKETRPSDEIAENDKMFDILNFYFDRTPLELVFGLITERGIWSAEKLKKYLKSLRIHPILVNWQVETP
ncbi:MAG: translation initiation factor eIF-2B [Proteobacteria bacterium]|nr:translation initiation factor eIF-2B [Pseudomonadota bacterium]NIS68445.1 translation initiation factor eIF-2B [Pseudomonadota bacterium]